MIDTASAETRVRAYVAEEMPALDGSRVVMAASGGADSTAMVMLLCESGVVRGGDGVVAHFDHRLRGDEASAGDRASVAALCARYGLEYVVGSWDEPRRSEAAAREARYMFLRETAEGVGAACLVTGHTRDDHVETIVMNAMRGSGLHGLAGIAPEAALWGSSSVRLMRPLLGLSRAETRAYCVMRGLRFVDDPSNDDRRYLRNRLRSEMSSVLAVSTADLVRAAAEARRAVVALEDVAADAIDIGSGGGEMRLDRGLLAVLGEEVRPYAFRIAIRQLLGDVREFGRKHYALMCTAAAARTGAMFELPRGIVLTVDADALMLSVGAPGAWPIDPSIEHGLPFEGAIGGWYVSVRAAEGRMVAPASRCGADGGVEITRLPAGSVVRGRRPGDRIRLRGMAGIKKLQDEYIDRKVPRRERDAAPVIARGGDVLWTPFRAGGVCPDGMPYDLRWKRGVAGGRAQT